MKANVDKCHLLVTRDTDVTAKIGEFDDENSREEKLLVVKIAFFRKPCFLSSTKLSFENHVSSFCKMASQKSHALKRFINFVDLAKRKSIMKAFITSQFNYCRLICIFHSRQLNKRSNKINERALSIQGQQTDLYRPLGAR